MKNIHIWGLVVLLMGTMFALGHYWPDFRRGMEFPLYHNCECK